MKIHCDGGVATHIGPRAGVVGRENMGDGIQSLSASVGSMLMSAIGHLADDVLIAWLRTYPGHPPQRASGIGALQRMDDTAAYRRRCPNPDLPTALCKRPKWVERWCERSMG